MESGTTCWFLAPRKAVFSQQQVSCYKMPVLMLWHSTVDYGWWLWAMLLLMTLFIC